MKDQMVLQVEVGRQKRTWNRMGEQEQMHMMGWQGTNRVDKMAMEEELEQRNMKMGNMKDKQEPMNKELVGHILVVEHKSELVVERGMDIHTLHLHYQRKIEGWEE